MIGGLAFREQLPGVVREELDYQHAHDSTLWNTEHNADGTHGPHQLQAKIRPWDDVCAYGAKGDGLADDTVAVKTALAAAGATGGSKVVYFPAGTYIISDGLTLKTRCALIGPNGYKATNQVQISYKGGGTAITLAGSQTRIRGIRLYSATGATAVDCGSYWGHSFEDVDISQFTTNGFIATDAYWTRWTRCYINLANASTGHGIVAVKGFNQCVLDGVSFTYGAGGVWTGLGINTTGVAVSSNGSVIQNCDFSGGAAGGLMIRVYATTSGLSFIGNRCETAGADWLQLDDGASGIAIIGNQIAGSTTVPATMLLTINGSDVFVSGNSFYDAATAIGGPTGRRIAVGPNYYHATITTPINLAAANVMRFATAASKHVLALDSTTTGFLPPRLTTTERDAITSPTAGLVVYNSTTNKINVYTGAAWEAVTSV